MTTHRHVWLFTSALAIAAAQPAFAADTSAATSTEAPDPEAIVVTGYRASLLKAQDVKRSATIIQDSIVADDIAAFPDLNLAEALQRLPGIAINREAGEGRRISLRGLGPDFTRVQLNGMEVLGNVDSPQDSRGQGTRDRAFDFNIFAAELFNRVDVKKSYSADQSEGGLAGTVGLYTARPLDYDGDKFAFSAQGGSNSLTKDFQPRLTGLVSKNWGDFGLLVSAAYSHRQTREQGHDTYRWRTNGANGSDISGLTEEEQDKINSGTLRFARGNRLSVWDSTQDRLGITASMQWNPGDSTHITLDGLYGKFKADRFETHLASRGSGGSTWLGGAQTFAGVTYPASTINAIAWNDDDEVTYLDVSGAQTSTETRTQKTSNTFKQAVLSGDTAITDKLTFRFLGGIERSSYAMPVSDKFYTEAYGDVITQYTGTYGMKNTYGWDTTDPSNYHAHEIDMSASYQDTAMDTVRGSFDYTLSPDDTISVGGEWRRFKNSGYTLTADDVLKSSFQDGSVSADISDYYKVYNGYPGQSWVIVDYAKALSALGIDRSDYLTNRGSDYAVEESTFAAYAQYNWNHTLGAIPFRDYLTNRGSDYAVEESTFAAYAQYNWNHTLGAIPFRGNIGGRFYHTGIDSVGVGTVDGSSSTITGNSSYQGFLPAANLIFDLSDKLVVRAAAARNINRPTLSSLAVNGTVTSGDNGEVSVSTGNPNLKPYKSTDLDLSVEYYMANHGSLSAALFYKTLDGFIATKTVYDIAYSETGLSTDLMDGLTADTVVSSYSRPINLGKTDLWGLELAAQSDFSFLPGLLSRFGASANFTYVNSQYDYRTIYGDYAAKTTLEGLSKYNANATLYYADSRFDARVSGNYRSSYVYSAAPITTTVNGETVVDQDLSGYAATLYVDASAHFKVNDYLTLTLNGVNLTNQAEKQYSDTSRRLYVYTRSGRTIMGGFRVEF
ncbi:TonB-dependent receptor [Novosphingobium sp. 1949]|uniref:TonB-dependent receptor n=1 Tax=Novosphingobium organovorum TaxID=2930092 RepID=A0ABT0BHF7_9SPHN|nr:TonB-dependent receptor [Novosphingobium organovorum]MCJ2184472.1 TonB-dependent receptor [Novosphingobium organovorum]